MDYVTVRFRFSSVSVDSKQIDWLSGLPLAPCILGSPLATSLRFCFVSSSLSLPSARVVLTRQSGSSCSNLGCWSPLLSLRGLRTRSWL